MSLLGRRGSTEKQGEPRHLPKRGRNVGRRSRPFRGIINILLVILDIFIQACVHMNKIYNVIISWIIPRVVYPAFLAWRAWRWLDW